MSQTQERIPIRSAEAGCSVLKHDRYKVAVPVFYPNLTILIHGVNDVGVAYQAQDEGLCKGLNARLNRSDSLTKAGGDLLAADYNMSFASKLAELEKNGDTKTAQKLRSDPDSILYHRADVKGTWSPVIPFYWGFREEDGVNPENGKAYIDKTQRHGEWLDRHGNRLDKNGSKGGGPFANATSNIADFWSGGKSNSTAWLDKVSRDPLRPLKATPRRRYFVLAALRLASLIEMIRKKPETKHAAINIMGHSQGCLITLLAQAILAERKVQPADCLILQHPPYSLEETFVEGTWFDRGSDQQTVQARLNTLVNIVGFVTGKPQTCPALAELSNPAIGRAVVGKHWQPGPGAQRCVDGAGVSFAERDNRGKVYLYFSHHDQTVSLLNVQGVGWQGVPDKVDAVTGYTFGADGSILPTWTTLPAMNALKSKRFFQRVFTEIKRDGQPERVGLRTNYHYILREKGEASPTGGMFSPSASVPKKEERFINGEPLNPPCTPSLGAAKIPIDYVDASIALTSGRIDGLIRTDWIPDSRPPERRGKMLGIDEQKDLLAQAQADYDRRADATGKDYATANRCRVKRIERAPDGRLMVHRTETPNEMKERLLKERADTNSFHSGIPANPEHHEKVSAYDLALGAPVPPDLEVNGWLPYLRAVADWRTSWTELAINLKNAPDNVSLQRLLDWHDKESPDAKALIDATFNYRSTGELPSQVAALTSVSLLISQTDAERYRGTAPRPFKAPA